MPSTCSGCADDGRLGAPTVNTLPGAVPFATAFDRAGHLLLAEAGTNSVAGFDVTRTGTLAPLAVLGTGQAATCWITATRHYAFASNAGSASVTGVAARRDGSLSSVGQTATDTGTVDAAATPDGRFLYVQAGGAGHRRRVPDQRRRLADPGHHDRRTRRRGRRGNRRLLTPADRSGPGARASRPRPRRLAILSIATRQVRCADHGCSASSREVQRCSPPPPSPPASGRRRSPPRTREP